MGKFYKTRNGWAVEMALACAESFQKTAEPFIERIAKDLPEGSLQETHERGFGDLIVSATNLAFALETYLKILRAQLGLSVPKTHDLSKLYKDLPPKVRSEIENRYDDKGRSQPLPVRASITLGKAIRQEVPVWQDYRQESKALGSLLERSKDVFKVWRYVFEGDPKEDGFQSYQFEYLLLLFACEAVRAAIRNRLDESIGES
ncbi:MAG: hypothetical protein CAF45_014585 [Nitrospira sp. CG24E]|nr:MAG: hypothetical protein CAF45_014585 [Nitrospira sp. CG24E]